MRRRKISRLGLGIIATVRTFQNIAVEVVPAPISKVRSEETAYLIILRRTIKKPKVNTRRPNVKGLSNIVLIPIPAIKLRVLAISLGIW